jgi:hypothetical protein
LQVLAKPANVPEGQQQILVLPVRIDNEYSQVSIRLIKKRQGSRRKGNGKEYSVQITVAPSCCGPVAVQMEYLANRNLNVRLNCEKPATRLIFESDKSSLNRALAALGFTSVNILTGILPPLVGPDTVPLPGTSRTSTIDLTA